MYAALNIIELRSRSRDRRLAARLRARGADVDSVCQMFRFTALTEQCRQTIVIGEPYAFHIGHEAVGAARPVTEET